MKQQQNSPRMGPPMEITIHITVAYDGNHETSDQVRRKLSSDVFAVLASWRKIGVNGFIPTKKTPLVPGQVIHAQAEFHHGCLYGERHHDIIEI